VLLIDRGLLDGSAYVSKEGWQALMDDMGLNTVMMRDNRYDAILHMVTAADGAEKFYDSLTNPARYETVEEAVNKDKKLREVYMGHQKWIMIDNQAASFESKIMSAKEQIHNILGHSTGSKFYRKFLLKKTTHQTSTRIPINLPKQNYSEESEVLETFLKHQTTTQNGKRIVE
jgi:hypothetical protein